ncbi:Ig-like domain repeat protein [Bradyrhizobium sp. 26S5]|uniref:Ig-like domain repeat protein n=1 Tax=Bradyrhizobium sp. 26S5 TaxID=3139729 RepID=UPI0039C88A7B
MSAFARMLRASSAQAGRYVTAICLAMLLSAAAAHAQTNTTFTIQSVSNFSPVVGETVTINGTVSAADSSVPSGTMRVAIDAGPLNPAGTVVAGAVTLTSTFSSAGPHSIIARFVPDNTTAYNISNTRSVNLTAVQASTTTALTSSLNPSVAGQPVTFTATVSVTAPGTGTPTGAVNFLDGGTLIGTGTLSGNRATFTTSSLPTGSRTITAVYVGDSNYTTSTSSAVAQRVDPNSTTTALASSANPSTVGQSVTLTATITPAISTSLSPTGTVTFSDGGTPIGTGTVSGGVATFTTSSLSLGNHSLRASYGGDTNFNGSSVFSVPQTVNQDATSTTLSSSANPGTAGVAVTFTATVAPASPTSGAPTGTVSFFDGATLLGTGTLSGGSASFTTSSLPIGSRSIPASIREMPTIPRRRRQR